MFGLKTITKVALVSGAVAIAGIGLYYVYGRPDAKIVLSYNTDQGDILINGQKYEPGEVTGFKVSDNITFDAVPATDYYFYGWLIDGNSLGIDPRIIVSLKKDVTLISAMFSTGQPGNGTRIPSTIYALNSPVAMSQRVACGVIQGYYDWTLYNRYILEDWATDGISMSTVQFKVEDSAGVGIGGLPIELWSNSMPDNNDNKMAGGANLLIHDHVRTSSPLLIYTSGDGVAQAILKYLPVDFEKFVKQHNHICSNIGFCQCEGRNVTLPGWAGPRSIKYNCPASGPDAPGSHLVLPVVNVVYAKLQNTVLQSQAVINCALEIRTT